MVGVEEKFSMLPRKKYEREDNEREREGNKTEKASNEFLILKKKTS